MRETWFSGIEHEEVENCVGSSLIKVAEIIGPLYELVWSAYFPWILGCELYNIGFKFCMLQLLMSYVLFVSGMIPWLSILYFFLPSVCVIINMYLICVPQTSVFGQVWSGNTNTLIGDFFGLQKTSFGISNSSDSRG